jgi:hypothetical protein
MEPPAAVAQFLSGLGVFFAGIGVLWFVSVYKGKKEEYCEFQV